MFSAYAKLGDAEFLEIFGLDFEEFQPGQVFLHRPGITLNADEQMRECMDTFNAAFLHYDAHYAAQTEFGQRLGVSSLTLQKVLGATWKTFARKDRITEIASIATLRPVYDGTTLYALSEIQATEEADTDCGLVTLITHCESQQGERVASISYKMRVFRAGRHPYFGLSEYRSEADEARFSGYCRGRGGALTERSGLHFEDFRVGETFHHRPGKTIAREEALTHARHGLDWNPRFTNANFSAEYFEESTPPVTEAYLVGAATALTTRTLGRVVANLEWRNLRLHRLGFPGDHLLAKSQILEARDSASRPDQGLVRVRSEARLGDGTPLVSYERLLLVYRRGGGPYQQAGYG